MLKNKEQIPFWLFTVGAIILLILPFLVQDGMFPDGVLYAAVSHNLVEHKGTIWFPYFDNIMFPFFYQKPPLTFGLQAIFFKFLGHSIYVERIYSFLTAITSAALIVILWRRLDIATEKTKKISWLPVLLWIIVPICCWSYRNNMVENTMGVFSLLAVIFMYEGSKDKDWKFFYLIGGGVCVILGYLCNGNAALFPLTIPILYYVIHRPSYSPFKLTWLMLIAILTPLLIYGILIVNNHIYESIHAYQHERMLNSIENEAVAHSKFYALAQLFFVELIGPLIITAAIVLGTKTLAYWKDKENAPQLKTAILFLSIGFSASLLVLFSDEQRVYYLVPSFPYYAIAFAIIAGEGLMKSLDKFITTSIFKVFSILSIVIVGGALVFSFSMIGKTNRDKEMLHDVYIFGKLIPPDTVVRVYRPTWQEWQLHNYFVRHFNISLASDTSSAYRYFINERSLHRLPPPAYTKLIEQGEAYDLYKKE
ncbi:MAG TPA: glycosyltransferase family 39 protein [Bacteroidia bacterium]|nr:glycosyltransferase family 39 protein [Bacteroidia bacterium]